MSMAGRDAGPERRNVLVSAPGLNRKTIFLPYIWAVLKTHAEGDERVRGAYRWLDPIYLYHGDALEQLEALGDRRIDVLALSCYVWNWSVNLEIAARVKARNPGCLVVAGGPHPSWTEPGFIDRAGAIDVVVKREGEEAFRRILAEALAEEPDISRIPNLILRGDRHTREEAEPLALGGRASPILAQGQDLERFARAIRDRGEYPHAMWETNRGCPYSCSFCDWGSATNSKVRTFDMDRLREEVAWFASARVHTVFVADANYGILRRDEETARWLAEAKAATGFPEYVVLNSPKNRQDTAVRISEILRAAGMHALSTINFQHTKPSVLAAIDRQNIPVDRLMEPIVRLWRPDAPLCAVLVSGNPGDTLDLWKECHDDLLEWGFHDDIVAHDFAVLPNAPAASPGYRERWGMRTVTRRVVENRVPKGAADRADTLCEYVVATSTFDEADWVEMKVFTAVVQGLHNHGATRFLAQYLRLYHGVRYRDFYEALIAGSGSGTVLGDALARVRDALRAFLDRDDAELVIDCHPELPFLCSLDGAAFFLAMLRKESFYAEIGALLGRAFDVPAEILSDLLLFQGEMVVTPDHDPSRGKEFRTRYDWAAVFREILLTRPTEAPRLRRLEPGPGRVSVRPRAGGRARGFRGVEDYYLKVVRPAYMRGFAGYFRDALTEADEAPRAAG